MTQKLTRGVDGEVLRCGDLPPRPHRSRNATFSARPAGTGSCTASTSHRRRGPLWDSPRTLAVASRADICVSAASGNIWYTIIRDGPQARMLQRWVISRETRSTTTNPERGPTDRLLPVGHFPPGSAIVRPTTTQVTCILVHADTQVAQMAVFDVLINNGPQGGHVLSASTAALRRRPRVSRTPTTSCAPCCGLDGKPSTTRRSAGAGLRDALLNGWPTRERPHHRTRDHALYPEPLACLTIRHASPDGTPDPCPFLSRSASGKGHSTGGVFYARLMTKHDRGPRPRSPMPC